MRCPEDAPKPPEENPVNTGTSSGHLNRKVMGKKNGLDRNGVLKVINFTRK